MSAMLAPTSSPLEQMTLDYLRYVQPDGSAVIWAGAENGGVDLMVERVDSDLPWRAMLTTPGYGASVQCSDPVEALHAALEVFLAWRS